MTRNAWENIRWNSGDEESAWELFHENSKTSRFDEMPSKEVIAETMKAMYQSLAFDIYTAVELPLDRSPLTMTLGEALSTRTSARSLAGGWISLAELGCILHHAYGITRDNKGTNYPRPFRVAPSGGALYPLEIFFHARQVEGLAQGIYHYNPVQNDLRCVLNGNRAIEISTAMVQQNIAFDSSVLIFITAIFERSTFKYGDRGYRFVLLEAGHVAQNLNLAAHGLGFGYINLGGYYDREIDEVLGIDGVTHSTVYMGGIGRCLVRPLP